MNTSSGISTFVRPQNMDEIVGLDHIKKTLYYDINGCIKLNEPFPSYIIFGPPGCSKSTVAGIIANICKGNIHKYIGTELKRPDDIYQISQNAKDKDVIYVEEAHGIGKPAQIILLEWIENYKLLGGGEYGSLDAPRVSFVFPTTNPGKLVKPLRERCRTLQTSYYKIDDIKEILRRAGAKYNLDLSTDDEALTLLAQSSRGTPRTALIHRLDMLRKYMAVENRGYSYELVEKMLEENGINEWGLEPNDIKYCQILYDKLRDSNNKGIAKKTMVQSTGFDDDLIDLIESYLQMMDAIRIETHGRLLTPFGCSLIGKEVIKVNNSRVPVRVSPISLEVLRELVQDPEFCSKGMRAMAEKFNLRYGPDNHIMKAALEKIGFTTKKRAGIVPND